MSNQVLEFSAVVTKEGRWYVALSPEVDVASQGKTVEEALANLKEALELRFEDEQIKKFALKSPPLVTIVRVSLRGKASRSVGK